MRYGLMNNPERAPAQVYTVPVEEAAELHDLAREEVRLSGALYSSERL